MKKSTSFRLSSTALDQLAILSKKLDLSQTKVLENLIGDRASVSDQRANEKRMHQAWDNFAHRLNIGSDNELTMLIFLDGYRNGWAHFQTRHTDDVKNIITL